MDQDIQPQHDAAVKKATAFLADEKYDSTSDAKKLSAVLKAAVKKYMANEDGFDDWVIAEIGEQMEGNPAIHQSDVQAAVYALADLGYALTNEPQRVGEIRQTLRSIAA